MEDSFQQETEIDHQLMVIRKEFTPDMDMLEKEFNSEKNRVLHFGRRNLSMAYPHCLDRRSKKLLPTL